MSSSNFYNPQNDGVWFFKTMGFISHIDAYIFWGVFTPLFFALGSVSAPGSESFVHSGSAPDSALGFELALLFVLGRRFCLNRVWTGFVQCLFNGCSMVVTMRRVLRFLLRAWMRTRLLSLFRLPWVFVFWWLRLEFIWVVVFPGRRGKFSPRRGKKSGCLVRRCVREVWTAKRHPCESPQNGTGADEDGGGNRLERKVFEQASNESDEKNKEDEMDEKKETDTNTVGILPN